jgi:hypothetical protein
LESLGYKPFRPKLVVPRYWIEVGQGHVFLSAPLELEVKSQKQTSHFLSRSLLHFLHFSSELALRQAWLRWVVRRGETGDESRHKSMPQSKKAHTEGIHRPNLTVQTLDRPNWCKGTHGQAESALHNRVKGFAEVSEKDGWQVVTRVCPSVSWYIIFFFKMANI